VGKRPIRRERKGTEGPKKAKKRKRAGVELRGETWAASHFEKKVRTATVTAQLCGIHKNLLYDVEGGDERLRRGGGGGKEKERGF